MDYPAIRKYYNDIPQDQQPQYFLDLVKKNKGDFQKITGHLKNLFSLLEKMEEFYNSKQLKHWIMTLVC